MNYKKVLILNMKFSNIKVLLNLSIDLNTNEFFDININYDNLEKGDTLNR